MGVPRAAPEAGEAGAGIAESGALADPAFTPPCNPNAPPGVAPTFKRTLSSHLAARPSLLSRAARGPARADAGVRGRDSRSAPHATRSR